MSRDLRKINYLDLLRGFVAVGRRRSVTEGAEDLALTQSAVSRQIRTLEERLNTRLFIRGHRSIAFTPEGESLFLACNAALDLISDAVERLPGIGYRQAVTLSASIGVTGLWLLPRLGRFQALHPEVEVRVAASNRVVREIGREGVDLAIRYCDRESAPAGARRLFEERIAPVAHPGIAPRHGLSHETLGSVCLLEFDSPETPWLKWQHWLDSNGLGDIHPCSILRFNQYDQLIYAAMAGQGIALGRTALLGEVLGKGSLVALLDPRPPAGVSYAYWLVTDGRESRPAVAALRDWLMAEAECEPVSAGAELSHRSHS
ncbi:hypothetical protein B1C78_14530 [Thioalkalivibrio denitrificans]|uniref:HTH lysR-type domain-containing protein n=1 Tax=Thioalkalivibrio denitrificans TaxID=108003 RepID=A0A1V3NCQ7_9GAMM|nr:LysR substrate-binding domain-containing protein [Thioalkalivibrio denitrificans]OOG22648.1 hypothetical protein B1C78_14530 [Thioalkalivibrio denitrificans]